MQRQEQGGEWTELEEGTGDRPASVRVWIRLFRELTGCLSEPPLPIQVYPHREEGESFCFCKVWGVPSMLLPW